MACDLYAFICILAFSFLSVIVCSVKKKGNQAVVAASRPPGISTETAIPLPSDKKTEETQKDSKRSVKPEKSKSEVEDKKEVKEEKKGEEKESEKKEEEDKDTGSENKKEVSDVEKKKEEKKSEEKKPEEKKPEEKKPEEKKPEEKKPEEKKPEEKKPEEKKPEEKKPEEKKPEEKKPEEKKPEEKKPEEKKPEEKKDEKPEEKKPEEKKPEEKKEEKPEEKVDPKKAAEELKPHVTVEPTSLSFVANQTTQTKMTMKNVHDKKIMFKIKMSDNDCMLVTPVFGVIEPGKTVDMTITHRTSIPKEGKMVIVNSLLSGDEKKVAELFKLTPKPTGGQVTVKWVAK